jgi:hypothetical protein
MLQNLMAHPRCPEPTDMTLNGPRGHPGLRIGREKRCDIVNHRNKALNSHMRTTCLCISVLQLRNHNRESRRLDDLRFAVRLGDAVAFERGLASILKTLNAEPYGRAANVANVSSRRRAQEVDMSRLLLYATATAVLGCAAQAQQPNEPAHKTMLLTGCLHPGPDRQIFKLSDATLLAPATSINGSSSPQAAGTVGGIPEYELTTEGSVHRSGPERVDLNSYVGRRVEVTARPPEIAPSPNSASSNSAVRTDAKADEQKPPRLIVTAIKQASSSCQ